METITYSIVEKPLKAPNSLKGYENHPILTLTTRIDPDAFKRQRTSLIRSNPNIVSLGLFESKRSFIEEVVKASIELNAGILDLEKEKATLKIFNPNYLQLASYRFGEK